MASNFILTRCDGGFGCDCPAVREVLVRKKIKRNEYMRKYLRKRRASANGSESS